MTVTPPESLTTLLGGRRTGLDATAPVVAFVGGWLVAGQSVVVGVVTALVVAAALAVWRLARGTRPRAVLIGLLMVSLAALVTLHTGRAADFFLVQLMSNAASALAWLVSIVVRWPLLGVVLGLVLGQKARWRRDPALLRGYSRASWLWVTKFSLRVAVFLPLWWSGQVVALGVARMAMSWPLVAACLGISWWVVRRTLPPDHPGLRHPILDPSGDKTRSRDRPARRTDLCSVAPWSPLGHHGPVTTPDTGSDPEAGPHPDTGGDADSDADSDAAPQAAGRHRSPGRRRSLWLTGGGAALAVSLVGVVLAAQSGAAPACAARIPAAGIAAAGSALGAVPPAEPSPRPGKASFYDVTDGGGNCSFPGLPVDRYYAALGPAEYADAAACGGYLDVTGPRGTVRVMVIDQCPECAEGHVDLSREAFAEIADPVQGEVAVTYRGVVDPPLAEPLALRLKDGVTQFWFAVLVTEHGNPLASVEARQAGQQWRAAQRQNYNYWIVDDGLGPGPYTIRVTDVHGQAATVDGIRLAPEQVQHTEARLYGGGGAAPTTADPTTPPSPAPSPVSSTRTPRGTPTPASESVPRSSAPPAVRATDLNC